MRDNHCPPEEDFIEQLASFRASKERLRAVAIERRKALVAELAELDELLGDEPSRSAAQSVKRASLPLTERIVAAVAERPGLGLSDLLRAAGAHHVPSGQVAVSRLFKEGRIDRKGQHGSLRYFPRVSQ